MNTMACHEYAGSLTRTCSNAWGTHPQTPCLHACPHPPTHQRSRQRRERHHDVKASCSHSSPVPFGSLPRIAAQPTTQVFSRPQPRPPCTVSAHAIAAGAQGELPQEPDSNHVYSLKETQVLVETAMLAAVGGLAYLLSTILKLDGSLGYFLPLPIVLSAMRGGGMAGFKTMFATAALLVVLLGPLRSVSYVLIHGLLAATLATLWRQKGNFWLCVVVGAAMRMLGQLTYLMLSSVTMNENLFAIMMSNVYAMLDQICASMGVHGAPSPLAIGCMLFALLLVNALCYVFLLQIIYRIILQSMGYNLGPLPNIIKKYLTAGMPEPEATSR